MGNQMQENVENETETLGPCKGVYRATTGSRTMETQIETNMPNSTETLGLLKGV